jgi:thymidylate synthase (FAD)
MVSFQFRIKMPIFCARQIFRHRTSSVNEISGRYSVMKDEFYFPDSHELRSQSKTNKQGSDGGLTDDVSSVFSEEIENQCDDAYALYQKLLDSGVAREQARMVLPLNLYTEFYWKQNLHNLLHLLALRTDAHAQQEIRVYAEAMLALIKPLIPWTLEAWEDYHPMRGAIKLTRLEIETLRSYIEKFQSFAFSELQPLNSDNKREQSEWMEKAKILGINVSKS